MEKGEKDWQVDFLEKSLYMEMKLRIWSECVDEYWCEIVNDEKEPKSKNICRSSE